MKHQFYTREDKDTPEQIKDRNGDIALRMCKICQCTEASLPTECPGGWIGFFTQEEIAKGNLDYVNGRLIKIDTDNLCPKCNKPLKSKWSGIECAYCSYWFCY